MIITIDGPAGSGKSVITKRLAHKLHFAFFDTGAMYRAVAWCILKRAIDLKDEKALQQLLDSFSLNITIDERREKHYFVDGEEITLAIRSKEVTEKVSEVSAFLPIRQKLVFLQRKLAEGKDVVFEGRDLGTIVFPQAELKIFLTAEEKIRVQRRFQELKEKNSSLVKEGEEEVLKSLQRRDLRDSSREHSPLKQAEDAVLLDTSSMTIEEVLDTILALVRKKRSEKKPMKMLYKSILFLTFLFFKLFYHHKVYGLEHFCEGAAIIASNHLSFLDPPAIAISCPEEVHFLARKTLFKNPFFGRLIRSLNSHPISGKASDIGTFKEIKGVLQQGKKILLFPEGTRSKTGEIGSFQRGIGFMMNFMNCPILPAFLLGTFSLWPREKRLPKFSGKTACIFGSPILPEDFAHLPKKEKEEALAKKIEEKLKALEEWSEKGFQGTPP